MPYSLHLNGEYSSGNNINATAIQTDHDDIDDIDEDSRSSKLMKLELLSLLVTGSSGVTQQDEVVHREESAPERGTFVTNSLRQDYDSAANVTFQATAVRESYTLQDVQQALHQGLTGESHGKDESFVDFVMGGMIEDELELYRRKKSVKMLQRTA